MHDESSRRLPGRGRLGLAAVAVLLLSACQVHGLNFIEDHRVQIIAPEHRAQIELPVTIEWEVTDFEITAGPSDARPEGRDAGYFAVLVDRAPPPPGEPLAWLARDDDGCVAARGCPDAEWFAQRRIFTTTDTSFTIAQIPLRNDNRRELHEVVIILLDPQGRRIGESAFAVQFEVVRNR